MLPSVSKHVPAELLNRDKGDVMGPTMLDQILRSGPKAGRQNQRTGSIFRWQVEETFPAQSDQALKILVLEAVPLGMREVRYDMTGTPLATNTVLCGLA